MTEPAHHDRDRIRAGVIGLVALGVAAVSALVIAIAWWLVVPPPRSHAIAPSPLRHELFDGSPGQATAAAAARAAGLLQLERTEWIDRDARVVRIPIDRAIDAVVADPALIGAPAGATRGRIGELAR